MLSGSKNFTLALLCLVIGLSVTACKEEQKVTETEPVKIVFDPAKAKSLAIQRLASVDVDADPIPEQSSYIRLVATSGDSHAKPDNFLKGIVSDDTKAVVLLAHISNGAKLKLPAVPLYLFEKQHSGWEKTFQAAGNLSPFFVTHRAPLSISVEMVLLKDKLDRLAEDAEKLVQAYGTTLALYSKEGAHEISTLADGFAQRIGLVEEAFIKDISTFNISYLENFGNTLNLIGSSGEVSLATNLYVEGRESVLPLHQNTPPTYSDLLSYTIGLHSPRTALADLEAGFWSVPAEMLHPSCQAIHGALKERLGLSERDSALVLWRMIQPHALFADGIDYRTQCSGEDMAAMLQELGFSLPAEKKTRAGSKTQNAMNKSLSTIARLLKNSKDGTEQTMQSLMASSVLIRDQARLLYSTDPSQVIHTATDVIAPTFNSAAAAEYLLMLPVQSYGCYSRGTGQVGSHRASLIKLENDPSLWLLNFAFDTDHKISGIQLRSASQNDFCRAIGGRKGSNRCTFSGKSFPGLTPDKCG